MVQGSRFRVQRRRWRLSPHIYMGRCPKAGCLHPCPLLLKTFSKIKKLFSIVKSFSIFGNLFTILNSLNMERKGGTPMLHPFCLLENDAIVIFSFFPSRKPAALPHRYYTCQLLFRRVYYTHLLAAPNPCDYFHQRQADLARHDS